MGYQTDFDGSIEIVPALNEKENQFIQMFNKTRHMDREKGQYFVDGTFGHGDESDVRNSNKAPYSQPGLWCGWTTNLDADHDDLDDVATEILWDDAEKFYDSPEWMAYLIEHFLGAYPLAKSELPFLQGHILNGTISAQGEEPDDMWLLHVVNNVVTVEELKTVPSGETRVIGGQAALPSPEGE